MGKSSIAVVLCLFAVSTMLVDEVTSECCTTVFGYCMDGTKGTPYCGYGKCNAFGCDCDGGCRKSGPVGRGLNLPEAVDGFAKIDTNGDGKVSLEEAKSLINSTGGAWKPETHVDFARMDVDFDGFLSKDEVDPVAKAHFTQDS